MSGRILGANLLKAYNIVSEVTTSGYPAKNMVNGRTSNQAGFTQGTTGEVVFDMGSVVNFSGKQLAIGIAKHNLGSTTASITVAFSNDTISANFGTIATFAITADNPQILQFTYALSFRYIRFRFTNHDSQAYISDLTFNELINIKSGQPVGYVTPAWGLAGEVVSNVTFGNELAGITLINKPNEFKINISYVNKDDSIVFDHIKNIVSSGPFYFKWANLSEDGIDGAVSFAWLNKKMMQLKYDSMNTRGTVIDCVGFV